MATTKSIEKDRQSSGIAKNATLAHASGRIFDLGAEVGLGIGDMGRRTSNATACSLVPSDYGKVPC
jgi:hypothetical protein